MHDSVTEFGEEEFFGMSLRSALLLLLTRLCRQAKAYNGLLCSKSSVRGTRTSMGYPGQTLIVSF